jgi:small-conductance mechanosensitive channel
MYTNTLVVDSGGSAMALVTLRLTCPPLAGEVEEEELADWLLLVVVVVVSVVVVLVLVFEVSDEEDEAVDEEEEEEEGILMDWLLLAIVVPMFVALVVVVRIVFGWRYSTAPIDPIAMIRMIIAIGRRRAIARVLLFRSGLRVNY